MDSFPVQFCRNIRLYWRRKRYQRLEGSSPSRKSARTVKLGGGGGGALRRSWKIRRAFRLRVKLWSPIKLLARLRDTYVNAMLGLAGKGGRLTAGFSTAPPDVALWARRIPKARSIPTVQMDFETRMLVEIYKSFLSPLELAAI